MPEFGEPVPEPEPVGLVSEGPALHHVRSVGYALDLLGASFPYPVPGN